MLSSALPPCGQVLMAGSDFIDTLSDAYQSEKRVDFRKVLVANVYVGLTSLLKGAKPNLSLLLDQLFSLKASAGVGTPTAKREPTILSDLICSSDLLARLERYLIVHPQKRGEDLLSSLRSYRNESKAFHHRYQKQRKKTDKGKGRVSDLPTIENMHVHRMSLVTQVQDLFPDLGSGYIVRLLDHYGDNPETVVAHLLDGSLPPELQELDQSEQLPVSQTTPRHDPLPPRPTPPEIPSPPAPAPARKNIFDNDVDLAKLARSADQASQGKLRFGRADSDLTADAILADRSQHAVNKAAIMSALATFDSDDDERDDTYDVADVGGTVDGLTAVTDAEADADLRNRRAEDLDMTLLQAYKANPALFARDSATRRSQPRASLKRETGMTDEAIEGWGVMLARDPKRLARLEDRLAMSAGGPGGALAQPELPSTAYRKPGPKEDGESDSDTDQPSSASGGRGGPGRGRGRGGRRGGGGGRVRRGGANAGASGEQNPAVARQKKEENKASRANHNRRQQRARKIARGGGMPG
ncbi:CUE domain-containing protein 3 [Aspergillus udagawae]|nr:CUE domain-containing protein 3 [Aspergillus udagawae]GFG21517.1 CUE domain-containing protein 3 [Aspergillus udagawae]